MSDDINDIKSIDECFDWIRKYGSLRAKAKASCTYLEHFRKSKKAMLHEARRVELEGTRKVTEMELDNYARSHPEYLQVLKDWEYATFEFERMSTILLGVRHKFEVWRTLEANKRAELAGDA